MKAFDFFGHQIASGHVVAVGPVEDNMELGGRAFVVFLSGGTELTFREVEEGDDNRSFFIREWTASL